MDQFPLWTYCHTKYHPVGCACFYFYTAFSSQLNPLHSSLKSYSIHCLSSCTVWPPFLGCQHIEITSLFKQIFYCNAPNFKAPICKITQTKAKDNAIGTLSTQRPFQGFLLNSGDNIQSLHHSHWWYLSTSDILTQLFVSCTAFRFMYMYSLNQPTTP